jgi:hypothetical protein
VSSDRPSKRTLPIPSPFVEAISFAALEEKKKRRRKKGRELKKKEPNRLVRARRNKQKPSDPETASNSHAKERQKLHESKQSQKREPAGQNMNSWPSSPIPAPSIGSFVESLSRQSQHASRQP